MIAATRTAAVELASRTRIEAMAATAAMTAVAMAALAAAKEFVKRVRCERALTLSSRTLRLWQQGRERRKETDYLKRDSLLNVAQVAERGRGKSREGKNAKMIEDDRRECTKSRKAGAKMREESKESRTRKIVEKPEAEKEERGHARASQEERIERRDNVWIHPATWARSTVRVGNGLHACG
eukprot:2906652-Pleurochrysis_carterae.AAC.3